MRALTKHIDINKNLKLLQNIDINCVDLDTLVKNVVDRYCNELDTLVKNTSEYLNSDTPLSDSELEHLVMRLPVVLYYVSDMQEDLGIRSDVAKAFEKEQYNLNFEDALGTIKDKEAYAELNSQQESIIAMATVRAYKKIQKKVSAAFELLNSVKKVMDRRLAEYNLSRGIKYE